MSGRIFIDDDTIYSIREESGIQRLFKSSQEGKVFTETSILDLPAYLSEFDVSMIDSKLYLIGLKDGGSAAWVLDLLAAKYEWESIKSWPGIDNRLPDLVASQGGVYVFSDNHASKLLPDGEWKTLSLPPHSINASSSVPCGHAHILFFNHNSDIMTAFHTITGKWVNYTGLPQVSEIKAVLDDGGLSFWIITAANTIVGTAIIPASKDVWVNYAVIGLFIIGMLYMGFRLASKEASAEDYFKGGGKIPWWASGLSLFATGASALSLMGMPGKSYAGTWLYMGVTWFMIITLVPLSAFVFAPIIKRLNIATANEYLERRFNLTLRLCGAILFALNQFFVRLAGSMVFPAIALNSVFGLDITACILIMGIVTTCYVYLGGLQAVHWTRWMKF